MNNSFRPEHCHDWQLLFEFTDDGEIGGITEETTINNVVRDYELFENMKMSVSNFGGTKVGEHGWGS